MPSNHQRMLTPWHLTSEHEGMETTTRRLFLMADNLADAHSQLAGEVRNARAEGMSWAAIAAPLGETAQAVQQRTARQDRVTCHDCGHAEATHWHGSCRVSGCKRSMCRELYQPQL